MIRFAHHQKINHLENCNAGYARNLKTSTANFRFQNQEAKEHFPLEIYLTSC